jgi:hypothetical protein
VRTSPGTSTRIIAVCPGRTHVRTGANEAPRAKCSVREAGFADLWLRPSAADRCPMRPIRSS